MAKYESRDALLTAIDREHEAFVERVDAIPAAEQREEGAWGDGWRVQDLLAHLTEWEQMFLTWYRAGVEGEVPALPAPGFKWNETPRLNRAIYDKHRRKSAKRVRTEFDASFAEIREVATSLTEEELFTPGHYAWTGKNTVVTYIGANTASHYRTAAKILKRWQRERAK